MPRSKTVLDCNMKRNVIFNCKIFKKKNFRSAFIHTTETVRTILYTGLLSPRVFFFRSTLGNGLLNPVLKLPRLITELMVKFDCSETFLSAFYRLEKKLLVKLKALSQAF